MRAVVQRVSSASVSADGKQIGKINRGLVVFLGVEQSDCEQDIEYIAKKISQLRIFEDDSERMNLSVTDVGGSVLLISQFTLYGDARKGNRPSFVASAHPIIAMPIYERVIEKLKQCVPVECGIFGAMMDIALINDGPVTILLDSKRLF